MPAEQQKQEAPSEAPNSQDPQPRQTEAGGDSGSKKDSPKAPFQYQDWASF